MIVALGIAPQPVIEVREPNAREISLQAVVKLPVLNARERAVLESVIDAMPASTREYTPGDMLLITQGRPVRISAMPDHVRISVTVAPDALRPGLSLVDSLLRRATLRPADLRRTGRRDRSLWTRAIRGPEASVTGLNPAEAQSVYRRVFRPESVSLAVGGPIVPGEAQRLWEERLEGWTAANEPPLRRVEVATGPAVSALEISGPVFPSGDVALSARLLTLTALGNGKGSSLHRILRERHGWSYRQESLLWPVPNGWQPRLVAVADLGENAPAKAEILRAELIEDIKQWTDADLQRALGLLEAVLMRGLEFSPLYVTADGPPDMTLEDRTFLAAYWPMKTGREWDPLRLLISARQVRLADLKEMATELVASGTVGR